MYQDLYHEGSRLIEGFKYTLRTEAMYSRRADDDTPVSTPVYVP